MKKLTPDALDKFLDKVFAATPDDNKILGPLKCIERDGRVYCYDKKGKLRLSCLKETFNDLVKTFGKQP